MIKLRNLAADVIAAIASGAGSQYGVYTPAPSARKTIDPGTNGTTKDGWIKTRVLAEDNGKIIDSIANTGQTPASIIDTIIRANQTEFLKATIIDLQSTPKQYTTLAPAYDPAYLFHNLDATANVVGVTEFTPAAGKLVLVTCSNSANAVTIKAGAGVTFDATNNTATFAAAKALLLYGLSATRWLILSNVGTVTFSAT